MSIFHCQQANRKAKSDYAEIAAYCASADMRLSKDPIEGYWLHYDGRMRFIRSLSDVRGWIDYLNVWNP